MKWFLLLSLIIVTIKRGESVDCNLTPKTTLARLKNDLMCEYDKTVRPVTNHKNATSINLNLVLKDFTFEVDAQKLILDAWLLMSWDDQHLKWKPETYEKIDYFIEESEDIWTPDISPYNGDVSRVLDSCGNVPCKVDNEGSILCLFPCSYVLLCEMDFTYWPYDRQNCSLELGSWTSTSEEINYNLEQLSLFDMFRAEQNEYKMVYKTMIKSDGIVETSCCGNQSYPSIIFSFIIERHASFEEALILFPVFVLIAINLIGLWLEPGCYERLVLFITNIILHFLLILNVIFYVPKNGSEIPQLIYLLRNSTLLTAIIIIETIITTSITHFQSYVPVWIHFSTHFITDSVVGKYFISENLNDPSLSITADDNEALIKNRTNTKENTTWKLFAKLLDRLLFLIYTIMYIYMFVSLIPRNYEKLPEQDPYVNINV